MNIITGILDKLAIEHVYGHCDVPCGIYDPHLAQVAAHTVLRMDMLIAALPKEGMSAEDRNKMIRYVAVKEQHAEICKHEIRAIWGDYFKAENAGNSQELHELVWKIMKSASKGKQTADLENAKALVEDVNKFAELFWKSKNVKTIRMKAPYPTEADMVMPTA